MDERELRQVVEEVVRELGLSPSASPAPASSPAPSPSASPSTSQDPAAEPAPSDLATRVRAWLGGAAGGAGSRSVLPAAGSMSAVDRANLLAATPARLDRGRAGTRLRTGTLLSFQEEHAAAKDAVASVLDPKLAEELNLIRLRSAASDRAEFLMRPDRGRRLDEESLTQVRAQGPRRPAVLLVVCDGLSATALNVNLPLVLPRLRELLTAEGLEVSAAFYVENGRVVVGDEIAKAQDAEVLCTLVGERPGLRTAESLGAYVTYVRGVAINESRRNMISNIHQGGLAPDQGAAQIAQLCLQALKDKRTGVEVSP